MTAEGWNGKSIRQHVAHVESEAARAVEIAEGVEEQVIELRRLVESLGLGGPAGLTGKTGTDGATLRDTLKFIQHELDCWRCFVVEAKILRDALEAWRSAIVPPLGGDK